MRLRWHGYSMSAFDVLRFAIIRGMSEEYQSDDADAVFEARMRREIEAWRSDGLISDETSRALLARVESPEIERRSFGLNRISGILAVMGAVLVGLGVIGLVAVNWNEISDAAKLAFMLAAMSAAYAAGWFLTMRDEYPRVGGALLLLGAVLFGATIHLVAQSFNVSLNHPNLVAAWFLGVLPPTYVARSRPLVVLTIVLFYSALGFRAQEWFGPGYDTPIPFFLGLAVFVAASAFLFTAGRFHARFESHQRFVRAYEIWGFAVAGAGTFIVGSIILWRESFDGAPVAGPTAASLEYWLLLAGFSASAVLGMLLKPRLLPRASADETRDRLELAAALAMVGIAVLVLVSALAAISWAWVVFNLFLLAAVIAMVAAGVRLNRGYLVNIAIVLFGLTALTRYFEIAIMFEIFDQAWAYIFAGVLLIAMAAGLERLRKRLLGAMREETPAP